MWFVVSSHGIGATKLSGLEVLKRRDGSFLSICGNNDFIVIATRDRTGDYHQDSDLNLTSSSWVIIQPIITS